jgi:transcriptional regulator GlxA family with amidase domain
MQLASQGLPFLPNEEFLQRVLAVVEKHLDEEEFSVETFAREAGVSRTQLHRKLCALIDQSTSQLIRSIRLQ